jgi:hypothetical protein
MRSRVPGNDGVPVTPDEGGASNRSGAAGSGSFQSERRRSFRMAFSSTPSSRAMTRLERPAHLRRSTSCRRDGAPRANAPWDSRLGGRVRAWRPHGRGVRDGQPRRSRIGRPDRCRPCHRMRPSDAEAPPAPLRGGRALGELLVDDDQVGGRVHGEQLALLRDRGMGRIVASTGRKSGQVWGRTCGGRRNGEIGCWSLSTACRPEFVRGYGRVERWRGPGFE